MKKNNTAEKTAQDAKKLTEALKESAKKSLKEIMAEALSNIISDEDEETEAEEIDDTPKGDEEKESFEVNDVETKEDEQPEDETAEDAEGEEAAEEDADADEWSDMEEFKVGDNDYDFTGVDGETALKVYNKLGDDDQIVVKKEDDGTYTVSDEETGAEYVIELNADEEEAEPAAEIGDDDEEEETFDIEIEDDGEDEENLDEDTNFVVDDYQKKDAIEGLSMNEPANAATTYSMDGGAPKGTERPYAKSKGDAQPFDEKVNENAKCPKCGKEVCECGKMEECGKVEECGDMGTAEPMIDEDGSGLNTKHSTKKNMNHINRSAQNQRNVSTDGKYEALKEAALKIYNKAKAIQEENNKYKGYIAEIKKSLTEAAVLNVSLTQALKLMCENATSANEKKSMLQRFSGVKTIQESKALYETIKGELNENHKSEATIEKQISAAPEKASINETVVYKNPALDLMNRVENLHKY